jgi:DNA replication and repair protein RecF
VRLLALGLRNFRNYSHLDFEPGPQLNVLLGRNGQGKTNLLESVALLALSSSPRARREGEVIGPVAGRARIEALVEGGGRRTDIDLEVATVEDRAKRTIRIAGTPRRAVDLPGHFRVTLFWPEDLNLVKAGPDNRRRLLNQMLVQVEPGHARSLSRYQRVLDQRNHLLKQVAAGEQPRAALEVWDQELVRLGLEISRLRAAAVAELAPLAAGHHERISGGEHLSVEYLGCPRDLLEAVQRSLDDDLRRGATGVGPHRDDILIRLEGADARAYASQGQQRTAVVSLKLAEAALIERRTGEAPVLLLDDVLSELDLARRQALLERVTAGGQVIISSVEADPFPESVMAAAVVRCIETGRVIACG